MYGGQCNVSPSCNHPTVVSIILAFMMVIIILSLWSSFVEKENLRDLVV